MSLEAALAENTQSNNALAAIMANVVANQERLLAGQEAAIAKIEQPKASSKPAAAAAAPKKADEPAPVPNPAPAVTPQPEAAAAAKTEVTDADVKAAAIAWMNKLDPVGAKDPAKQDKDVRTKAAQFLSEILAHFGTGGKLTGPESKLDADQRKQAKFYIERKAAGASVDFNAEYDFDGEPTQGVEVEGDPLG